MTVFETLNALNVNDHTEQKTTDNGRTTLTYLSWPWAWAEVKKRYPDAHYEVVKNENGLPCFSDDRLGIMVYTRVTIDGVTHEMWLPVMDSNNKAMRFEPYEIATKYKTITVKAATMFDVNKTVMRCLVKNLAMFGLGLYIYAGEDLPDSEQPELPPKPETVKVSGTNNNNTARIKAYCEEVNMPMNIFANLRSALVAEGIVPAIASNQMTEEQLTDLIDAVEQRRTA